MLLVVVEFDVACWIDSVTALTIESIFCVVSGLGSVSELKIVPDSAVKSIQLMVLFSWSVEALDSCQVLRVMISAR